MSPRTFVFRSQGSIGAENTHPFIRELWGRYRIFAHRQAPFAQAHLIDDVTVDFSALTTPDDKVAVIATTPLTDNETWTRMKPGELLAFQRGEAVLAG